MSKPSIVIVHGGFHVPAHFNGLYAELRKSGYIVTIPALPSMHVKPAVTSHEPDVCAIQEAIDIELALSNDVVVLAHSYAGFPATDAVKDRGIREREQQGLKGGVVALIYLSAIVVDAGTAIGETDPEQWKQIKDGTVDNYILKFSDDHRNQFYNMQKDEVAERALSMLRPLSFGVLTSKSTYAPWPSKAIPLTYILCENDHCHPPQQQEMMATVPGRDIELIRCDGDHSPFLDRPEWVAKVIRRAAGESDIVL